MPQFLSEEWLKAARSIRQEYAGRATSSPDLRMNIVIKECPPGIGVDGLVQAHLGPASDGLEVGHLVDPQLTVTMPYDTAQGILVDGDPRSGMQAFMTGRITVQGDMTKLMAIQAGPTDPLQTEIAERIKAITQVRPAAAPAPPIAEPPPRYIPSTSGPLTNEDLAQILRLADLFGAWVNRVSADDPRLPRAEITMRTLNDHMRVLPADRVIVRRCTQIMVELLFDELVELAETTDSILEDVRPSDHAFDLTDVVHSIDRAMLDDADPEEWQEAGHILTDAVDEIEKEVDPPDVDDPRGETRPTGRGTRLRKVMVYVGSGLAMGTLESLPQEALHGSLPYFPRLLEQLLNVIGL